MWGWGAGGVGGGGVHWVLPGNRADDGFCRAKMGYFIVLYRKFRSAYLGKV